MAEPVYISGEKREKYIREGVDKLQKGETRRGLERGRHGASNPTGPKRWPAKKRPHTGEHGEPAYGTPIKSNSKKHNPY